MLSAAVFAPLIGLAVFCGLWGATKLDGLRPGLAATFVFSGACAGFAFWLLPGPVPLAFAAWTFVMVLGLAALAAIDGATREVPDFLTLPMIALGLAHAATLPGAFIIFGATALVVIVLGIVVARLMRGKDDGPVGGGDILLFAGAAAWLGPLVLIDVILISAFLLVVQWTTRQVTKRRARGPGDPPVGLDFADLPLAPALGFAQATVWLGGTLL